MTTDAPKAAGSREAVPGSATIVIPVRNARSDLVRCLRALGEQSLADLEILVVDDGSSDGTAETAGETGARVIRQDRLGASRARNRGVCESDSEFVLFIDADCVPEPQWAEVLLLPLRQDPTLAGTIGRYDTDQSSLIAQFVQIEHEGRYERMKSRDRIDFLNSGTCAFRRGIIARYPFDPEFHRLEDVELSFRLMRDGHSIAYVPEATVLHRHPERLGALLKRKFNYARYAFTLYRQYPGKVASDSSTPQSRRARLAFLALFLVLLPFAWLHPALLAVALLMGVSSIAMSFTTISRGFRASPQLGLASIGCVLAGNVAFLAGAVRGLLAGKAPEAN